MSARRRSLVVIGHGMVAQKLVATMVGSGATADWDVTVVGEERHPAYDRVHLSSLFDGAAAGDLSLVGAEVAADEAVTILAGERVEAIERDRRVVLTSAGRRLAYDAAVLATGSVPFVPPVPGRDLPGCFVYRTVDDVEAIRSAAGAARCGVVVGGGLLGLEAANALRLLGLATRVVEYAPRLMPAQLDGPGGDMLRARIEELGVEVAVATTVAAVHPGGHGRVSAVELAPAGGGEAVTVPAEIVVFSAGIRPRDDLARSAGLRVGERGGVVVDGQCRTSDPAIFAVGECACALGRVYGLVSPGYQMARVVADTLAGRAAAFTGADTSTKLKLLGVDVASFGDAHGDGPGTSSIAFTDAPARTHKRLVVDGAGRVVGGVLVGDTTGFEMLAQMAAGSVPTPEAPASLITPGAPATAPGPGSWPEEARVCSCENVTAGAVRAAVSGCLAEDGTAGVAGVKAATRAGTGCGGCVPTLEELVRAGLAGAGVAVSDHLCEHFPYSRRELFDIVAAEGHTGFASLLASRGRGRGCEICKPVVASVLASVGNDHVLDGGRAALQDTNDHFLANLQKDGTYSVVPRVPGGEITAEKLVILGEVARDFGLYVKITGGQRIDLLGARVDQLPPIWARLVAAGFESGHAYGKALRTVKSCVGDSWCRYGVGDSTAMAIGLELRYRGLRAPHKIKMAVSGCTRECAEARSKDVGVIATERGWNLFVGGNGGTRPRHADLLAEDLDDDTLVWTVDRFLMYYVRTAGRLQRTSAWLERFEGGVGELRAVLLEDSLGIGADLDAAMARHVATYRCEWRETLEDPVRLARFRTFVNSDDPDPDIVVVTERDQPRPARTWERVALSAAGAR